MASNSSDPSDALPHSARFTAAVAAHYDDLDQFYREVWGEHLHHGLWETGHETQPEAVLGLVERVAEAAGIKEGFRVVDIGCGYGCTARWLGKRYGAHVTGYTLSKRQATYAATLKTERGTFVCRVQDWLENDLEDSCCDAAMAIESLGHMTDKRMFFDQAFRVLRPGGRLAICAWLEEKDARRWERKLLVDPVCREGRMPEMGTAGSTLELMRDAGFTQCGHEDLTLRCRKSWPIAIGRAVRNTFTRRGYLSFLLNPSNPNRAFGLTMVRILIGQRTGAIRYGLITGTRL